jgi:hypothetical protein
VAGCVLLALWLRWRDRPVAELGARAAQFAAARALPGWLIDGALCGALTLLRPELSWVPLWWWFGLRVPEPRSPVAVPPPAKAVGRRRRGALLVLAVWFAFSVPWAGRNWRVTGDPFFALQRHAEHVKGTAAWPEYSVYRSLEPQPLLRTVRADPAPLLTKTRAGIGFYLRELGHWLPWSLLAAGGVLWFARGRWRRLPREPLFVVGVTGAGLILGYAPFDHELRHLVPLWPVATWELCLLAAGALLQDGPRPAAAQRRGAVVRGALLTGAVAAGIWLTPARLPGWDNAAQIAARDLPRTAALVARADALPPGALFTDNAALLWLTGRTGAWAPLDAAVEAELRRRVPQLTDAPLLMMDGDRGSATENNGD